MKDLGVLKSFLDVEVAQSREGFFLCQCKYALDFISKTDLLGPQPSEFPMEQNYKLARAKGDLITNLE